MPRYRIKLSFEGALGREAIQRKKRLIGEAMLKQTQERLRHGGDDEITFHPLDYSRPDGSSNSPLFWSGKSLYDSLESGYDASSVWVSCTHPSALVHQLGTVGKGGKLPTIKPKRAKALYIPKSMEGMNAIGADGRITGDLDDLEAGIDYIFVKKVDIWPRPFLRLSRKNREELAEIFARG